MLSLIVGIFSEIAYWECKGYQITSLFEAEDDAMFKAKVEEYRNLANGDYELVVLGFSSLNSPSPDPHLCILYI